MQWTLLLLLLLILLPLLLLLVKTEGNRGSKAGEKENDVTEQRKLLSIGKRD